MAEVRNTVRKEEQEVSSSGLLLSVEPLEPGIGHYAKPADDSDADGTDLIGDQDGTDESDSDGTDETDSDGTDAADGDGTDQTDGDGTDRR